MANTKYDRDRARRWREALPATQRELAKMIGVNWRLISAMEAGRRSNGLPISDHAFEQYRLRCAGLSYEKFYGRFRWEWE